MLNYVALFLPFVLSVQMPAEHNLAKGDTCSDQPCTNQSVPQMVATEQPSSTLSDSPIAYDYAYGPMTSKDFRNPVQHQVHIQDRVIIRVSPLQSFSNQRTTVPKRRTKTVERKTGECINADSIKGVRPYANNRLVIYLRDNRVLAANLEKACRARDFYSGFYVESSEDGKLCIQRDNLESRNGTKCKMSRLRELVAVPVSN